MYDRFHELEIQARKDKEEIDYLICKEKYGFGKGDEIKLSDEFIQQELSKSEDSFYSKAIEKTRAANVSHVSWDREYISLIIAGWRYEGNVNDIMKMQK